MCAVAERDRRLEQCNAPGRTVHRATNTATKTPICGTRIVHVACAVKRRISATSQRRRYSYPVHNPDRRGSGPPMWRLRLQPTMTQVPPTPVPPAPPNPPRGFAIKLLLLILAIITFAIAAILALVGSSWDSFIHLFALLNIGLALFAASFLPIP